MQKAIAVGIQSAQIFDHAGHIAQKLNHNAEAAKYFALSIQSNPSSEHASDARTSVSLATAAGDQESKASPAAAAPSVLQTVPDEPLTAPHVSDHNTVAVDAGRTSTAPVFAPIPEALLTPHPTGNDHRIHNAQTTVARNPNDAAGYAGLGAAYFQRARETGDVNDYQLAEQSLR